jgi:hypothetical protein
MAIRCTWLQGSLHNHNIQLIQALGIQPGIMVIGVLIFNYFACEVIWI